MIEPESVITCEEGLIGVNELLARQGHQRSCDAGARIVRSQLDDGTAVDPSALNGGSLDHGALRLREAIDSGCEQRLPLPLGEVQEIVAVRALDGNDHAVGVAVAAIMDFTY